MATQDTITQLVSVIRRVGRLVPGAAELIAVVCTGHDYSRPGKPQIDWDDPAAKDALVSALVNDANALVVALRGRELDEQAASAVALLALVAGPDNSDAAVAAQMIAREAEQAEVYGDSAYGTGSLRAALAEAGHQAVIKPRPLKPAVEGGFTLDDFTVDEAAGTVTCPAGITRPVTACRSVCFGAACRGCPLRGRCTTNKHGRVLILHKHDALLRAARRAWAVQPGLREDYKKYRPNVERVISQIASRGGRRLKLRYRGTAKNNAWLKDRTAALNLRNLIGRGLAQADGAWVVA